MINISKISFLSQFGLDGPGASKNKDWLTRHLAVSHLDLVPVLTYDLIDGFHWADSTSYDACRQLCVKSTNCKQFGFLPAPRLLCVTSRRYFAGFVGNPDYMHWGQVWEVKTNNLTVTHCRIQYSEKYKSFTSSASSIFKGQVLSHDWCHVRIYEN